MATFRVTTTATATVTYEYIVEANSAEEAEDIVASGSERDDGEEIEVDIDFESEVIDDVEELEF